MADQEDELRSIDVEGRLEHVAFGLRRGRAGYRMRMQRDDGKAGEQTDVDGRAGGRCHGGVAVARGFERAGAQVLKDARLLDFEKADEVRNAARKILPRPLQNDLGQVVEPAAVPRLVPTAVGDAEPRVFVPVIDRIEEAQDIVGHDGRSDRPLDFASPPEGDEQETVQEAKTQAAMPAVAKTATAKEKERGSARMRPPSRRRTEAPSLS